MSSPAVYHPGKPHHLQPAESSFQSCRIGDIDTTEELGIVGQSAPVERLRLQIRRIAPHFRTILLTGAPGTEKESVARALHSLSQHAAGPFIPAHAVTLDDCAHHNSPAVTRHNPFIPLIRTAQPGTLFLDGIAELPLSMQDHLLQSLRRHDLRHNPDLRLIASANEDLRGMATTGRFRQELYQRLAMVEITLPPLRTRTPDLPALIAHFLNQCGDRYGRKIGQISYETLNILRGYHWPGNTDELEGVLRSGILRGVGQTLHAEDLPQLIESTVEPSNRLPFNTRLQDVIDQHVLRVLQSCAGNKLRAAEALGVSRSTLYRMLEACSRAYQV